MKIRLNRYLSICGVSSRRKADELIASGNVSVNGSVIYDFGVTIDTEVDEIRVNGGVIKPERKRYIILYKPRLYVTALGKGQDEKQTLDELIGDIPERVYPVGRLDYDVEGLLLLTNDGELANRVMHPRYEMEKTYKAVVRGNIRDETMSAMKEGAILEDGPAVPDSVKIVRRDKDSTTVIISFHEGRNHLVKRYFSQFSHPVSKLKRISLGPLQIGSLRPGEWRDLGNEELRSLAGMLQYAI